MNITSLSVQLSYQSYTTENPASFADGDFASMMDAANSAGNVPAAAKKAGDSEVGTVMDTTNGRENVDLDEYFSVKSEAGADLLSGARLFAPTPTNIEALSEHASAKFSRFLSDNGIPFAPTQITYGTDGKMQLPEDYPFAEQLGQALESDPAMERELRTTHALASQFAGLQESLPFSKAYAAAQSKAEADAVVQKYSYLFSAVPTYRDIALTFSPDGALSAGAKVGV